MQINLTFQQVISNKRAEYHSSVRGWTVKMCMINDMVLNPLNIFYLAQNA